MGGKPCAGEMSWIGLGASGGEEVEGRGGEEETVEDEVEGGGEVEVEAGEGAVGAAS